MRGAVVSVTMLVSVAVVTGIMVMLWVGGVLKGIMERTNARLEKYGLAEDLTVPDFEVSSDGNRVVVDINLEGLG